MQTESPVTERAPLPAGSRTRVRSALLLAAGHGLFALGLVGAFVPVLPTTVFWILAAFCFVRSQPALAERIFRTPGMGPAVERFCVRGEISRAGKLAALAGMSLGACAALALPPAARIGLWCVLAVSAVYVATRREWRG